MTTATAPTNRPAKLFSKIPVSGVELAALIKHNDGPGLQVICLAPPTGSTVNRLCTIRLSEAKQSVTVQSNGGKLTPAEIARHLKRQLGTKRVVSYAEAGHKFHSEMEKLGASAMQGGKNLVTLAATLNACNALNKAATQQQPRRVWDKRKPRR